jgi:phosphohistidine phosphatase
MKTLLLVRHAKSSWDNFLLTDFERPLNDRGKHDAPMMAKRLLKKEVKIDGFISSPAKRAKKTAQAFAEEYGKTKKNIILDPNLYEASIKNFEEVIDDIQNKFDTVAIFSHNPGITDFANTLTQQKIDNIPTCGVFAVKADVKDWEDFNTAKKEFWFFDYPKHED